MFNIAAATVRRETVQLIVFRRTRFYFCCSSRRAATTSITWNLVLNFALANEIISAEENYSSAY